MSRENVEIALSLYRAVERQDASSFAILDQNVVWDMRGLGMPDLAQVYRGLSGMAAFGVAGSTPGRPLSSGRFAQRTTATT